MGLDRVQVSGRRRAAAKPIPDFNEPGHDPYARNLTHKDIRRIVKGMELVRETLGPDADFAMEAHWRYDTTDVIRLARALEPVNPMWLEDPVPPDNIEAMARVTQSVNIPDLHRRESLRTAGLPQADRAAGVLRRAHRHSEIGRPAGIEADLRFGGPVLHLDRLPQSGEPGRHHRVRATRRPSMREFRIHELAN